MKLNVRRTVLIGFAFFSICAFWQMYNSVIPLMLTNTFHLDETFSGMIMAADNVLALFLLPFFGSLSDRCHSRLGRRMPFILVGTALAVVGMIFLPIINNAYYADGSGALLAAFIGVLLFVLVSMGTYRSPAVALMPDCTPKPLRSPANAIINLMGAVGGIIAGLGGGNIVLVAIGVALKCLGSSPACYLILAMIADVIDHIEYRTGIRTDGLTMSIYSSLMVAATPICNSIFSAMLNGSGYNQAADVALGTAAQTASVQTAISVSYIWVETVCYIIGAVILILFWTVEKNLPEEQKAIKERSKK